MGWFLRKCPRCKETVKNETAYERDYQERNRVLCVLCKLARKRVAAEDARIRKGNIAK